MQKITLNFETRMLDYSPYFIIDAFNDGGHKAIDIKTPYGKLSDATLSELAKYELDVSLVKKSDAGYTYHVFRKKLNVE